MVYLMIRGRLVLEIVIGRCGGWSLGDFLLDGRFRLVWTEFSTISYLGFHFRDYVTDRTSGESRVLSFVYLQNLDIPAIT